MTVVLSPEIHEAVEYFKKNLGYSDKHLYLGLVQFDVMKDKNPEFAEVIYNFYKKSRKALLLLLSMGMWLNGQLNSIKPLSDSSTGKN